MKYRFPVFIRQAIFFKIPACRCSSISNPIKKIGPETLLWIQDREEGIKVPAFDITERYNGRERLVVTDVKLGESGGEVYRVTREEISVDTVQRFVDLHPV